MMPLLLQIESIELVEEDGKSADVSDDNDGSDAEDGETISEVYRAGAAWISLVTGIN